MSTKKRKSRTKPQKPRPVIGLLISDLVDPVSWALWKELDDMAQEREASLICFAGSVLRTYGPDAVANTLYGLVAAENVDGLVIWGGGLAQYAGAEEVRALCERYAPLPVVNAALPLEGVPSILLDSTSGMRDAVAHLIEVHGYRRIAFIQGPEDHPEAKERYQAYADALAEHDIPLDPKLVAPGEFSPQSGTAAIELLLDRRKLRPQADFEALVAADDATATGAIEALQARGIHVPRDVAIAGFDDTREARSITPPLTTVRQPLSELARQAVEMLWALMAGEKVPERVVVPTQLLVRQSCGCLAWAVRLAATEPAAEAGKPFASAFSKRRKEILGAMAQAAGITTGSAIFGHLKQLLDGFAAELKGEQPPVFLPALDDLLRRVMAVGDDVNAWQGAISALRRCVLPYCDDIETLSRAEDLWQQARVLIAETAQQAQARERLLAEWQARALHDMDEALITTLETEELMGIVAQRLPQFGIPSCYIALYEQPEPGKEQRLPPERARLILAYDENGRVEPEPEKRSFPSRQLVPHGILPRERRYSVLAAPLHVGEHLLGFILFGAGAREGIVYETLRGQLSGALEGALLLQERERAEQGSRHHAAQLATLNEINAAVASRLTPEEIFATVVQNLSAAFNYRLIGIYLIEEGALELKAHAGYGSLLESGATRVPTEKGVVGRTFRTGKPQLITNVAQDPDFFSELPGIASEICVPLKREDEILGVLNVESDDSDQPLDTSDLQLLTLLSTHIAAALENARLYEALEQELVERKRAENEARRRTAQAALIHEVSRRVSGELELDELLSTIVTAVNDAFGYYGVGLMLLDEKTECLVFRAFAGSYAGPVPEDLRLAIGEGMMGHAAATGESQLSGDISTEPHYVRVRDEETKSELAVPIKSGQKVIGVLDLQSDELDAFDEIDVATMETLSAQIATTIENARLFAEARSRAEELAVLNELGQALTARLSVEKVLSEAYRQASRLVDTTNFYIALYDPEKDEIAFPFVADSEEEDWHPVKKGEGLTGQVIEAKKALLLPTGAMGLYQESGQKTRYDEVGKPARSWLGVPLMIGDRVLGVMTVQSYTTPGLYNEHDRDLLTSIASQAAIALQNAYLFEETHSRAQRLAVVNRIAQVAGATLDLDNLLEAVYKELALAFQPDAAFIALYDKETNEVDFRFLIDEGVRQPPERGQLGPGLTSIIIAEKTPLISRTEQEFASLQPAADLFGTSTETPASWLGAPMLVGERVVGVINVQAYHPNAWDEEDELLLFTIADQVAVAIENARLFAEAHSRAEELAVLNELGQALTARLGVDEVLQEAHRQVSRLMDTTNFTIGLYDPEKDVIGFAFTTVESDVDRQITWIPANEGFNGHVVRNRKSLFIRPGVLAEDEREVRGVGDRSLCWLGVPLLVGDRVLGVMSVQSYSDPDLYNEHDRDLLTAIASQTAIALQNAYLFEETSSRAERLSVVNRIAKVASSTLHLDDLMETVYEEVAPAFQADAFFISLYDEEANELDYRYLVDEGVRQPPMRQPLDVGLTPLVIAERKPLVIRNSEEYERLQPSARLFGTMRPAASWLGAPMLVGERVIGAINVQAYRPYAWDKEDEMLLFTIADQVAVALANARLFEETQAALNETEDQARRLALLNEMGEQLSQAATLNEVLKIAVAKTNQILTSDRTSVSLLSPERDHFEVCTIVGEEVTWPEGARLPAEETEMGMAVRERRLLVFPDIQSDRLGDLRTYMIAPLNISGRAIGTLNVASKTPNVYTPRDQRLLLQIASLLAPALENRRLFEETQRRATQLALINDIGEKIAAVLELDRVLDRAAHLIHESFGYHHVGLFTLDHEQDELVMRTKAGDSAHLFPPRHRLKLGQGMVGWVSRHGETLLANDVRAEPRYVNLYPDVITTLSELCVPIRVSDEIVGVLDVQSPQLDAFDENDVRVIETLADQVAVAIENARLYEAVQRELAERKQAERALAQKARELARSNAELEQFAYIASHDLQEPLRMVQGYLQLLERRYKHRLDKDADEYIGYAVGGAIRMRTLINDLLSYSRVTTRARPFMPVDCSTVLDFALTDLKFTIEECDALVTHDPLPMVLADETQLKQVFQNLVSNGLKFRKEGIQPKIHIGAEFLPLAPAGEGRGGGGEWVFAVSDNGIGIDEDHFERVFEVFQRLHSRDEYPGSGIGLAICKKIVERHGGRIWVESEPGQGSTFYFTIPDRGDSS